MHYLEKELLDSTARYGRVRLGSGGATVSNECCIHDSISSRANTADLLASSMRQSHLILPSPFRMRSRLAGFLTFDI